MCKICLRDLQMATAEVLQAKGLASELLRWESRGPGDTDNALRRIAQRHKIEYGALWSLRYRKPKRIWADVANAIAAAYENERQRQIRKLAHDIAITEATAGHSKVRVAKARAVLRSTVEEVPVVVEQERQ